jgi:V/A-type H+/Na+-transporting ATPase subunit D
MNLRFQYNKTYLQLLDKQLKVRLRALPTLKNKEAALRMEVKAAKGRAEELAARLEQVIEEEDSNLMMWEEFDSSLLRIREVKLSYKKIAGVKIPELDEPVFEVSPFNVFAHPKWWLRGIETLKMLLTLVIEKQLAEEKLELLEYARKKTTQKVNLYEKVQIPAYEHAILKIKRYLEDEDNLAKAAQKIVKKRQQKSMEATI